MKPSEYTLLLVDDEDLVRESIAAYLKDSGYRIFEASDGDSGIELFRRVSPDVVLLDLKMPNKDGITVLKEISADPVDTPIIVISGAGVMSDVVQALRYGASDYLFKPISDMEVLEHSIQRCLEQGDLRRENLRYRAQLEETNRELKESLSLLEQDQLAGRHVQMKMLPESPKRIGEFQFSHRIFPSLYLSGDFVDYFMVGDRWAVFFMADVSGHGASSAFVTVLLKNLFARTRSDFIHQGDESILSPGMMLDRANRDLLATGIGKYATMCVGVLDLEDSELSYAVAGHLPLPLLMSEGDCHYLEGKSPPVGLFPGAEYTVNQLNLEKEFSLALFSDGILEVIEGDGLVSKEETLKQRLSSGASSVDAVIERLGLDAVSDAPDDIALLLISSRREDGVG